MADETLSGFFRRYDGQRLAPPGALCPHCGKRLPRGDAASSNHQYECATNEREMWGERGRPEPRQ